MQNKFFTIKLLKSTFFTSLGFYFLINSYQLEFGTVTAPGPGWLPFYLSVILILLGFFTMFSKFFNDR